MAAGHLGQQIGRGGGHHDQRRLARKPDVADLALVVEIEQLGEHAVPRERADRQRGDELLRRPGHHRTHRDSALAQAADEFQAFVGGDATADDQHDALGGDCFT